MKLTKHELREAEQAFIANLDPEERGLYERHLAAGGSTYSSLVENPDRLHRILPPLPHVSETNAIEDETLQENMMSRLKRASQLLSNLIHWTEANAEEIGWVENRRREALTSTSEREQAHER